MSSKNSFACEILPYVEGSVGFSRLVSPDGRPVILSTIPEDGRRRLGDPADLDERTIRIVDARSIQDHLTLEDQGFVLVDFPTAVEEFDEGQSCSAAYGAELETLIKRLTGADRVLPFGYAIRNAAPAKQTGKIGAPAGLAHDDYGFDHFGKKDLDHPALLQKLADAGIEIGAATRWRFLNAWRATSPPPQDYPLTLCDCRTVSPQDLIPTKWYAAGPDGQERPVYSDQIRYNPEQQWYYFSDLKRDEVIVFSGIDPWSDNLRIVPHSAFLNRSCGDRAVPRESIEVRFIALYDD